MFVARSISEPKVLPFTFAWMVVCLCLRHETSAEQPLTIIRDSKYEGDDFVLLQSLCRNSNQDPCLQHSGTRNASLGDQMCVCYCPSNRATFYEPGRQCKGNQYVRENGGKCKFYFQNEDPKGELQILSFATPRHIKAPVGKECKVDLLDHTRNMYLSCNGEWKAALINELHEKFEVKWPWSSSLFLKLKEDVNNTIHTHLNGRILRLVMKCRPIGSSGPLDTSCLLFKVQGSVTCPLQITQPTSSTASVIAPSEVLTSTKVTSEPPKTVQSIPVTPEALTTEMTESPATGNASGIKWKQNDNQNSRTTMAGVVGGVGGGLVLILVSALLARQWRKIRTSVRSDDVDGHQMYSAPSVATLERERALTITRDSGRYTETWYEEIPEEKTTEKETGENVYEELSALSQAKPAGSCQLYDDVVSPLKEKLEPTSFNQSTDPFKKGFCNPGFEDEPELDNTSNKNSSTTLPVPTGIETKEGNNPGNDMYDDIRSGIEISAARSNVGYVEMATNQNNSTSDGQDEELTKPKPSSSSDPKKTSNSDGQYAYAQARGNQILKKINNLKAESDIQNDCDCVNVKQGETRENSNPPYGNVNLSFVGDSEYVIPNTSTSAQTSTETSESSGYELMENNSSVVDEAGYLKL